MENQISCISRWSFSMFYLKVCFGLIPFEAGFFSLQIDFGEKIQFRGVSCGSLA